MFGCGRILELDLGKGILNLFIFIKREELLYRLFSGSFLD